MTTSDIFAELKRQADACDDDQAMLAELRNSWKLAPEWAMFRAVDQSGEWYWYAEKPINLAIVWGSHGTEIRIPGHLIPDFSGNWEESLQERQR